jgi:hypothetical protein
MECVSAAVRHLSQHFMVDHCVAYFQRGRSAKSLRVAPPASVDKDSPLQKECSPKADLLDLVPPQIAQCGVCNPREWPLQIPAAASGGVIREGCAPADYFHPLPLHVAVCLAHISLSCLDWGCLASMPLPNGADDRAHRTASHHTTMYVRGSIPKLA